MIHPRLASCQRFIDYQSMQAERILPFSFTLESVTQLSGGGQRYCYTVRGHGEGGAQEVDLSHFLLVTCAELTLDDLISAEVTISGQPVSVVIGGNVTVMTAERPDPTTGCTGIKFDFGLSKTNGVMTVCFTLARAFSVGEVPVCVKGGQVTLNQLSICGPGCEQSACDTIVYQRANVCVPVTIRPYARIGDIATRCCGASVVTPGAVACFSARVSTCPFTVSQELCMAIPVSFGASAEVGAAASVCLDTGTEAACVDCGEADSANLLNPSACPYPRSSCTQP